MKRFKKVLTLALGLCVGCIALASCDNGNNSGGGTQATYITAAIAREEGSGTRGAFDELVKNSEGKLLADAVSLAPIVSTSSSTGAVITAVGGSSASLGYISLGSVDANKDKIKAVKVDGIEATTANIVNKTYALSRPFNLVYPAYEDLSDLAKNFISYIESAEAQAIINQEYIACGTGSAYTAYTGTETKLTLGGSTSIEPLMKELVAAYKKLNGGVNITIEGGGSGTGIAEAGKSFDIGMASRELKPSETGVEAYKIADDGIAVIVNVNCALTNVTLSDLYALYVNGTKIECK